MNQAEKLATQAEGTELVSVPNLIERSIPEMTKMLDGDESQAIRFARIISTDCRINPDLMECTPLSFMGAMFTAAELKLEPVAGRAYLLPFWNNRKQPDGKWKKIREVQFVLGYKGIADLFYRHAKAVTLSWGVVHENDDFEFEKGTHSVLRHKRTMGERGPRVAYWVLAKMVGGAEFEVMSFEECMEHGRNHSKTYDSKEGRFYKTSPWVTATDSMCLKTVLIQLSKTLPLSVECQQAIMADESTRYVDPRQLESGKILDLPDQTNWTPTEEENTDGSGNEKDE